MFFCWYYFINVAKMPLPCYQGALLKRPTSHQNEFLLIWTEQKKGPCFLFIFYCILHYIFSPRAKLTIIFL